jgi:serine/threonine protein kinase
MGVVYEALDRDRNEHVALKMLRTLSAEGLVRFKDEFRSLQDLGHPNLCSLGELFEADGRWFFTMELIRGDTFLAYVCPGSAASALDHTGPVLAGLAPSLLELATKTSARTWHNAAIVEPVAEESRLRQALGQLALGLCALHAAGKVHRDIKPSNVLVTKEGRVVLVDFGLVGDLRDTTSEPSRVGTASYMAPEQAAVHRLSPAADWYSVGVVLYQALTGRLPFVGSPQEILARKARTEPVPPSEFRAGVPRDLDALCQALLKRDPEARPSGKRILVRLHLQDGSVSSESMSNSLSPPPFVGRAEELDHLHQAFEDGRAGQVVTVLVDGESGVGKSALVRRFTQRLPTRCPEAVVLTGRCYERESLPYKAVDGVVDSLARYMKSLPKIEAVALLPIHIAQLAQVFPVLRQVEAIAEQPSSVATLDPQELKRRVFGAFRELLARLAERHPVVVVIDDLQWADKDGLALLGDVLGLPDPPPLLVVATMRHVAGAEAEERSPALLAGRDRHVHLLPLPQGQAEELARILMNRSSSAGLIGAASIAEEAGGHPLFIDELVRQAQLHDEAHPGVLHLDEALYRRVARFDSDTRQLLELVSVAGSPLVQEVASQAVGCDFGEFSRRLSVLRIAHLLRSTGSRKTDTVECYHDRVREAVLANLAAKLRRTYHHRLALALEACGLASPEALVLHFRGAGQSAQAARYAVVAARQAATQLAFDHAADLLRLALELHRSYEVDARSLLIELGDALANAGRGAEAARAYLDAVHGAMAAEALDLQRRAAAQLFFSGRLDEGMAVLRTFADIVGVKVPRTTKGALLSLLWRRAKVRLRGLRFTRRDESQLTTAELMRIDVCWSLGLGLGMLDVVRGADVQSQNVLLALDAGEPYRVARALGTEAAFAASAGGRGKKRTERLLSASMQLATELDHPHALGCALAGSAMAALMEGRWKDAFEHAERATSVLRERCTGALYEVATTHQLAFFSLINQGHLKEVNRRQTLLLREAEHRGDLYTQTLLKTGESTLCALARNDPHGARADADFARRRWPRSRLVQDYMDLYAEVQIDIYVGDGQAAYERLTTRWPALAGSLLLGMQEIRIHMHFLRARASLSAALSSTGRDRASLLAAAQRDARRLEGEEMSWSAALATLVRAGIARAREDLELAHKEYAAAAAALAAVDMELVSAAARRRHGELMGKSDGKALVASADTWMAGQGVLDPGRMASLYAPAP